MSASAKCLQAMLAIFNLALLIFGILIIAVSSYLIQNGTEGDSRTAGLGLAIVSSLMTVIGFFGIVGAFCRQKCALIMYTVLLGFMIVIQLVGGGIALATAYNNDKVDSISRSVWNEFSTSQKESYQKSNNCCGYWNLADGGVFQDFCFISGGCRSVLMDAVQGYLKKSATFMFVGAACEFVAAAIAFILITDTEKRYNGYGRAFS
jgi:hypothetical protein